MNNKFLSGSCKKMGGFTLVELAIALMVIGLLIGGVLKGRELVKNAQITRVVKDAHDLDTAVMLFSSIYDGLPGDTLNFRRIPGCADVAPCNNLTGGLGLGRYNQSAKAMAFWFQLEFANMISGSNLTGTYSTLSPLNAFGDHYIVGLTPDFGAGSESSNKLYVLDRQINTSLTNIAAVDRKMDDGNAKTGMVMIASRNPSANGTGWGVSSCYQSINDDYTIVGACTQSTMTIKLPSLNP